LRGGLRISLTDRLEHLPVFFEVVPPHRRTSETALNRFADRVRKAVRDIGSVDAVNLPEVLDENHRGRPYYRNLDPRRFSRLLGEDVGAETVVNKVVVHVPSAEAFTAWLRETLEGYGLRNLVLVGGTSSRFRYPGPTVVEANEILRNMASALGVDDVVCGNITIPDRRLEEVRLLNKTRAGARFFTSQVLFEIEPMADVLRKYDRLCKAQGVPPATVFLSFAPVSDLHDLDFLQWMGADVSEATEDFLLKEGEAAMGEVSLALAERMWRSLRATAEEEGLRVPLGVNVEQISRHNFDLAVRMTKAFVADRS
jgi:5,10-methylenetetrahydrofolate reductase